MGKLMIGVFQSQLKSSFGTQDISQHNCNEFADHNDNRRRNLGSFKESDLKMWLDNQPLPWFFSNLVTLLGFKIIFDTVELKLLCSVLRVMVCWVVLCGDVTNCKLGLAKRKGN